MRKVWKKPELRELERIRLVSRLKPETVIEGAIARIDGAVITVCADREFQEFRLDANEEVAVRLTDKRVFDVQKDGAIPPDVGFTP